MTSHGALDPPKSLHRMLTTLWWSEGRVGRALDGSVPGSTHTQFLGNVVDEDEWRTEERGIPSVFG